jgi:formylmethanofuran dehydrogenase subunit D
LADATWSAYAPGDGADGVWDGGAARVARVEAVLITGRTVKQGVGLAEGKHSDLYRQETGSVEMSAAAMAELGAAQGDSVIVSTEYGTAVFICRNADLPDSIVFIPYGPSANRLTGHAAGRSGMPAFKGIGCTVRRDDGG